MKVYKEKSDEPLRRFYSKTFYSVDFQGLATLLDRWLDTFAVDIDITSIQIVGSQMICTVKVKGDI